MARTVVTAWGSGACTVLEALTAASNAVSFAGSGDPDLTKAGREHEGSSTAEDSLGLDDMRNNLRLASSLMNGRASVVEEAMQSKVYLWNGAEGDRGELGLVSNKDLMLHYYAEWYRTEFSVLGATGTAYLVNVWRGPYIDCYRPNMTDFVIFDVVLPRCGLIASNVMRTYGSWWFWSTIVGRSGGRQIEVTFTDQDDGMMKTFCPGEHQEMGEWLRSQPSWRRWDAPGKRRVLLRDAGPP